MEQPTWEELEAAGWEKRIHAVTKRVSYKTPVRAGRRKMVSRRRDLEEEEEARIGDVLFPPRQRGRRGEQGGQEELEVGEQVMEEQEDKEEQEVMEEQEGSEEQEGEQQDNIEGQEDHDHIRALSDMADVLKEMAMSKINVMDIGESVMELDLAMRNSSNPLRQELPLAQKSNFFVDTLKFAIKHNKTLVYTVLQHTTTKESIFDVSTVIFTAKIYILIASAINPSVNNTYHKLLSVILQSCGLSHTGITVLHKLGECEAVRSLLDTKVKLAVKDEINVQTLARNSIAAIVFDNMDKKLCKVIQHNTLPVLLFRNVLAVVSGDTSDSTSLKDVVADMDKDFLLLNSPKNKKEKEGFMVVLYTVLSDICSTIPYFEWAADIFPLSHQHAFKETSALKTERHIDTTLNIAGMKTGDVIRILSKLQWRYLSLLSERLEDKDKENYSKALHDIGSESVSLEDVREAEKVVMKEVERFGKLILYGDQKTVEDVQIALEARKDGVTDLEAFNYILIIIIGEQWALMSIKCFLTLAWAFQV